MFFVYILPFSYFLAMSLSKHTYTRPQTHTILTYNPYSKYRNDIADHMVGLLLGF